MANKKKNASANPNLDTVKDVFRKNRHITNRIQQKTVFEATDLSEKYYARRIKAVMHLLPEMKKRYAAKYPEMDMVSIGPTITGPHSPDEQVHIESVGHYWTLLTELLKSIPAK